MRRAGQSAVLEGTRRWAAALSQAQGTVRSPRAPRFGAFAVLAVLAAACAGAPARPAGSAAAPESEAWVGGAVEPAPPPPPAPSGRGARESGAVADGADQPPPAVSGGGAGVEPGSAPASADAPAVSGGGAGAKPGSAPFPAAVPVPAAERPFPSRVASVAFEVRVKPPGQAEIAGFVRDRDGNPVERACVELTGAGDGARSPVFTSGQGNFRFTAVPAGLVRVTMTVEELGAVSRSEIADYHTHDPRLTVMLRPLVLAPADGRIEVLRIKREGDLGQGDGTRWIEVAPLALRLEGYSSACREALRPAPPRPPPPRAPGGRRSRAR